MADSEKTILDQAFTLSQRRRDNSTTKILAKELAVRVGEAVDHPGEYRLVHGEAGIPQWDEVAEQLVQGDIENPIQAWMLAGVLATDTNGSSDMATVVKQLSRRQYAKKFIDKPDVETSQVVKEVKPNKSKRKASNRGTVSSAEAQAM